MSYCIVTPTRGDRPHLLLQCKKYASRQSISQSIEHIVINYPAENDGIDLTHRMYEGLKKAKAKGHKYAFVFEDDDWYSADYVKQYFNLIIGPNPGFDIYGIDYTNYIHVGWNARWYIEHPGHSSWFCACIKLDNFPIERLKDLTSYKTFSPDLDWEIFNDNKLRLKKKVVRVPPIAIGIKHNQGTPAGMGHVNKQIYARHRNKGFDFLKMHLSKDDYNFYKEKRWRN